MTMTCPICSVGKCTETRRGDSYSASCSRCGQFLISGSALAIINHKQLSERQKANASGWLREHQNIELTSYDIDFLISLLTPTVSERADKLLLKLSELLPKLGDKYGALDQTNSELFIATSWSIDWGEAYYLLTNYLEKQAGHIHIHLKTVNAGLSNISITPSGHQYIQKLKTSPPDSNICFCAMWFDKSIDNLWSDAIAPAIVAAGYDAKRIDKHEHNNRIDDEIIVMLRRSKFIVADFTGQRGGVYFEAGYALGQGIPVIWTCKQNELEEDQIHFDTRQYAFVTWSADNLEDFKKRLQNRIEATIGRGKN